jgi:DNA-binding HxlR family transcriptional regulator
MDTSLTTASRSVFEKIASMKQWQNEQHEKLVKEQEQHREKLAEEQHHRLESLHFEGMHRINE